MIRITITQGQEWIQLKHRIFYTLREVELLQKVNRLPEPQGIDEMKNRRLKRKSTNRRECRGMVQ